MVSLQVMSKRCTRRYVTTAATIAPALLSSVSGAWAFSASFAWCPNSGSPRFALQDVPAGTARLLFAMTDLNKPSFHHGGGAVEYRGQAEVPCGAFAKGFIGPSPPPGEVHTYEFTVKALGANGAALATATVRRKFPE
jgi:phosphatidylethanolamine-binding protein (PEBP) family uncharacterized protein